MVELSRSGDMEAALNLRLEQAAPLADSLERLTNEIVNRSEASMLAGIDETSEAHSTYRWVVIVFGVGSIGLALLLGYAISSFIFKYTLAFPGVRCSGRVHHRCLRFPAAG